jgi:hypothetical protein
MNKRFFEKVFSDERMDRYFLRYPENEKKSILHYQCNIEISESLYPCLSVFEVALRNSVNRELISKFGKKEWYVHFATTPGLSKLLKDINIAEQNISKRLELVSASKVVAELTFGFWTRLFNSEYERILWKNIRLAFPYMPKSHRKRKNISAPLNKFRTLRNRVFHNEPICWNFSRLQELHDELVEVMGWINKDLPEWISPFDRFNLVLKQTREKLMQNS